MFFGTDSGPIRARLTWPCESVGIHPVNVERNLPVNTDRLDLGDEDVPRCL